MTSPLGMDGPFVPRTAARGLRTAEERSERPRIDAVLRGMSTLSAELGERVKSCIASHEFASAVTDLRRTAEAVEWYVVSLSNHISWLAENGFNREDVRQIRYLAEVVYAKEPAHALAAAVALRAIEGEASPYLTQASVPFLADWPTYQARMRKEIWVSVQTREYGNAVLALCDRVYELSRSVPAKPCKGDYHGLAPVLVDCMGLSCEDLIVACAMRRMFIHAENASRRTP